MYDRDALRTRSENWRLALRSFRTLSFRQRPERCSRGYKQIHPITNSAIAGAKRSGLPWPSCPRPNWDPGDDKLDQVMPLIRRLLCVFWLASSLTAATSTPPRTNIRPNVILLTLDTIRADRMGFLGSERKLTPNLDELARQ